MPSVFPQDITDAILQQLRAGPTAEAFGDTFDPTVLPPGVMKFFGDYAGDSAEPICVIRETSETYTYFTPGVQGNRPFLADGTFQAAIFANSRYEARSLGFLVSEVLEDVPLTWQDGVLKYLRLQEAMFLPVTGIGPQTPTIFQRVLIMAYQYQGSLPRR